MDRVMAEWQGPDIVDATQDAIVLHIGQMLFAFLVICGLFGISIILFCIEYVWSTTKKSSLKKGILAENKKKIIRTLTKHNRMTS